MQSLPGRENINNVRRQEDIPKQEDRDHAEVPPQGRTLAEKQIIGPFFKINIKHRHSRTPLKIFRAKNK